MRPPAPKKKAPEPTQPSQYYVRGERTGLDVTCKIYTDGASVDRRNAFVRKQNERIEEANRKIDERTEALTRQLREKQSERRKLDDVPPELDREIQSLTSRIASMQEARKLPTNALPLRIFTTRSAALEWKADVETNWCVLTEELDLVCTHMIYANEKEAKARWEAIKAANRDATEANERIEEELAVLRSQMARRQGNLATPEDDADKAELQEEIKVLGERIAAREMELRPVIKAYPVRKFGKRAAADEYVAAAEARTEQAEQEAQEDGTGQQADGT